MASVVVVLMIQTVKAGRAKGGRPA
jgi:hypothetical protein